MALDQSALLEPLEALELADVADRIRSATETLYRALIEAELTAVIFTRPVSGCLCYELPESIPVALMGRISISTRRSRTACRRSSVQSFIGDATTA
jgi:hypothetical protein